MEVSEESRVPLSRWGLASPRRDRRNCLALFAAADVLGEEEEQGAEDRGERGGCEFVEGEGFVGAAAGGCDFDAADDGEDGADDEGKAPAALQT